MKRQCATVNYEGFDFEVNGVWIPYRKATLLQPEEGGYYDDCDIELNGETIYELLNDKAIDRILELGEEAMKNDFDMGYFQELSRIHPIFDDIIKNIGGER